MCVTPAGKIGNWTCGMPVLLPHPHKKSAFLREQKMSHFTSCPYLSVEGGIWSCELWCHERQGWSGHWIGQMPVEIEDRQVAGNKKLDSITQGMMLLKWSTSRSNCARETAP